MVEGMYQADGTIHVRFGGDESVVTFIPDKYVEQGGGKFVVFVPWGKKPASDCEVEVKVDGLVARSVGQECVPLHVSNGLTAQEACGDEKETMVHRAFDGQEYRDQMACDSAEKKAEDTSESGDAARGATPYNDFIPRLLEAAVKAIKVTVLVSHQEGQLTLKEVVVPAIPTKSAT